MCKYVIEWMRCVVMISYVYATACGVLVRCVYKLLMKSVLIADEACRSS